MLKLVISIIQLFNTAHRYRTGQGCANCYLGVQEEWKMANLPELINYFLLVFISSFLKKVVT